MNTEYISTSYGDFAYEVNGGGETTFLLLHGGASNLRAWDGVTTILGVSNRCVVVDLPGHGKTTVEPLKFPDLAHALVEICTEMNIKKPIIVGHSFGGLAAAITAVNHSELLTGVMAIDPYLTDREVQRTHETLEDAIDEVRNMTWPWKDTSDVDAEVDRCLEKFYSPRQDRSSLKAMIHRGYRLQADNRYTRFPRREDEMKGVEANWSIDVSATFKAIDCPLSIAVSIDSHWRLDKRKAILAEIASSVSDFENVEFQCGHDIPGYQPEKLSVYIAAWAERIAKGNVTPGKAADRSGTGFA